jgi:hypothetical protein
MSTRSIIAIPDGDAWKGRYCHLDGYPTAKGPDLFAIVARDGLEQAQATLVAHNTYWSIIRSDHDGIKEEFDDDRFEGIEGYGISGPGQGVARDEFILQDGDKWGTEWLYVLSPGGLLVGKVDGDAVTLVGLYPWGDEPDWAAVEASAYAEVDA